MCRLSEMIEKQSEGESITAVEEVEEEGWKPSEKVTIDVENLTQSQVDMLKALVDKYMDVFSKNDEDLGSSIFTHKIRLVDDTPIKSRPYRVPYKQLEEVDRHTDQMLRMGVIRKSRSPWASPIVRVEKKDGSMRFCVDFRKINEKIV